MNVLKNYMDRHDSEKNMKLSFIGSLIVAIIIFGGIIYVTHDNAFVNFEGTKSMIFSYVCAMIWIGFSNTIYLWSTESKYVTHRIKTGLMNVPVYLLGTCAYQAILAFAQAMIATIMFMWFDYDISGLVFGSVNMDILVTCFLSILGASYLGIAIGLFCTSVRSAIGILPIVLIAELLFSNGIFELSGSLLEASDCIHSKHALSAIGSLLDINSYPMKLKELYPYIVQIENTMFDRSQQFVLECWLQLGILALAAVLFSFGIIVYKVHIKK